VPVVLTNPLAADLVFCSVGRFDAVSGKISALTGTATAAVNNKGLGIGVATSSSVIYFPDAAGVNPTGEVTCLVVGQIGSTAADATMVSKTTTNGATNTPFNFGVGSGGNLIFNRANGSGYRVWQAIGSVVTVNKPFVALVTSPSTIQTAPQFWLNGSFNLSGCNNLYSGAGTGAAAGNSLSIKVGNRDDLATWFNGGLINLTLVWDRILSIPEVVAIMANPWLVFAP
jgi:hypothetical protein